MTIDEFHDKCNERRLFCGTVLEATKTSPLWGQEFLVQVSAHKLLPSAASWQDIDAAMPGYINSRSDVLAADVEKVLDEFWAGIEEAIPA
jgi:hypothetical protein